MDFFYKIKKESFYPHKFTMWAWLLLLPALFSFSGDNFVLIKSVSVSANFFTTDYLGNSYVVRGSELIQYDSLGNKKYNFSENIAGRLKSVDASNPLKTLLFYPDFAQINFLDSKFAVQSKILLRNIGIQQPVLACNSATGGFWVYDLQDFQLKYLTDKLQVKYESGNVSQVINYDLKPSAMAEFDNLLYVNNPSTGILVFDNFGTYIKTIPEKNIASFQVVRNELVFFSDKKLKSLNLLTFASNEISLGNAATEGILTARIEKQKLFLLKKENFEIYTFEY